LGNGAEEVVVDEEPDARRVVPRLHVVAHIVDLDVDVRSVALDPALRQCIRASRAARRKWSFSFVVTGNASGTLSSGRRKVTGPSAATQT
jgi:hypothetical protein